jgi:hypothetical protein
MIVHGAPHMLGAALDDLRTVCCLTALSQIPGTDGLSTWAEHVTCDRGAPRYLLSLLSLLSKDL